MDVFAKLKNTVSTTVSQLSGVLPGNPVTREYEATRHIASAGPGFLWKIYDGHKKSTKQEAAIFVFEKRILETYSKQDREMILEGLRRGVSQLTKLRHPKILTVQHPLEESRESLAFATEPVFASLANAIGCHENLPSPVPQEIKEYQLFEVEIKYGVLQICEALTFLHNDVRLLHRNVCPESIIINKSGAWKLSGFEFCISSRSPSDQAPQWPFYEWDDSIHPYAQPSLAHLAPEYALTLSCDAASNMFSLGSVIYTIFNRGKTLLGSASTFNAFKKHACELKMLSVTQLGSVPSELREHLKLLLNVTPELRPDAYQFSKIPYFEDVGAKTLEYLDSLFQWDNLQKSHFYKGLPQIITKMPKRVNLYRIMPCLAKEFVNGDMIPFVLPSVLLIAEDSSKEEFCQEILPELKPIFKLQEPIQILLIFMQKMELLLSKTPAEDIRSHVLPMIYRALESDAHQIQELCLNILPNFANLVDYPSMKNALLPRIKRLALTTQYLSVRVNCLVCIGKLLEHLDKWLVIDDVLPMLPEIPSREPAVLMGILGIYKIAMTNKKLGITNNLMATKVIPFLMPLSIENGLNLSQFNAIIAVVKEMVNCVENQHRAKLEQLDSIHQEQKTSLEMSKLHMPNKSELISGIQTKEFSEADQMFQGLGLGNYIEERDIVQAAKPPAPNISIPKQANPGSLQKSLTLEEKERLALKQEKLHKLKTQPVVQSVCPTTATQNTTTTKPVVKDLTSTLINSNLANMTFNAHSNKSTKVPSQDATPNYDIGNFNLGMGGMHTTSQNFPTNTFPQMNTSGFNSSSGATSPNVGWGFNNPASSPSTFPNMTVPLSSGQQQKPGTSSLDNLLAMPVRSKMSMNQMAYQNQIMTPFVSNMQTVPRQQTLTSPPGGFPQPPLVPQTNKTQPPTASLDLSDLLG